MPSSDPFPLVYDKATITSAQRLRLRQSRSLLFVLAVVLIISLTSISDTLWPWLKGQTPIPVEFKATLYGFGLVILVLGLMYIVMPLLDPYLNRWWRRDYQLALLPEAVRLIGPAGETLDVEWKRIKRVLRNEHAVILTFGDERKDFLILPRASLQPFGREALLDQLVAAAKPIKPLA